MAAKTTHRKLPPESSSSTPTGPPDLGSKEGRAVVFVGPTLDVAAARRVLDATYLPPAACGDLYRATGCHPWAIGLIDGYFQHTPSVWHKEILWAMQQGVHVFGSASMGALRAAELEPFGMVGVGPVFEAFRDRRLENDDEVAVAHRVPEPEADTPCYETVSEALVNIRFTLQAAESQGVLRPEETLGLIHLMQDCFYPERSYETLLRLARQRHELSRAAHRLAPWLARGRVDQKRLDALAMLRTMASQEASEPTRKAVSFTFQRTTMWLNMCSRSERLAGPRALAPPKSPNDHLLDELRLRDAPYRQARTQALARLWAIEVAEQRAVDVAHDADALAARRHAMAQELGKRGETDTLEDWASKQGLDARMLDRLLSDEALVQKMRRMAEWSLPMQLLDQLRLQGHYGVWSERARHKNQLLQSRGLDRPSLIALGLDEDALWTWYFTDQLQRPVPDDLNAYAVDLDFPGVDALRQAVLKEYCWQREVPDQTTYFAAPISPTRNSHDR